MTTQQSSMESPCRIRLRPLLIAVLAGAAVACLALLFFYDPATHPFYPRCAFYSVTGLQCPGCGGLRAAHALLHGDVAAAWRLNPVLVLLIPVGAVFGIARLLFPSRPLVRPVALWVLAIVVIAFGVLRNLPWHQWLS